MFHGDDFPFVAGENFFCTGIRRKNRYMKANNDEMRGTGVFCQSDLSLG
jgi:hypothetical protein